MAGGGYSTPSMGDGTDVCVGEVEGVGGCQETWKEEGGGN